MRSVAYVLVFMICLPLTLRSANAPFQPQHLTLKPAIDVGPNVFTRRNLEGGGGSILVFNASNLSLKGSMPVGSSGQMALSRDGKRAFAASIFMKRYVYGDLEDVLQVFDVATLSLITEIQLPPKLALVDPLQPLLVESADGRYILVQNATPASSVTVVDMRAGRVVGEIPTPGCFGIYPALVGNRFSTICGDGTFASYTLKADGTSAERSQSAKIFDADTDAIFVPFQRVGSELVFVSFTGNLYRLDDTESIVRLVDKRSITAGITGDWRPGGAQVIAYNTPNKVLFIGMHPHGKEGSHKVPAKEIWAYSFDSMKVLYRSPVDDIWALTVTDTSIPIVYASKHDRLFRFEVDPEAKFALKESHRAYNPGSYNNQIQYRP
jgi:methylamine dehydrogenase heavy chain